MIQLIQIQHHKTVILFKILIKYDKYIQASNKSFYAFNYNKESIYSVNKWINTLEKNLLSLTQSKMKFNQYGSTITVYY